MARKQSSTIWYQGNPHKEIYFQGHYHDKMYKGSQLVWEKLSNDSEYFPIITDRTSYDGNTYFVVEMYSINTQKMSDRYIGIFNHNRLSLDLLLSGFESNEDIYADYMIHACKDGLVLIEYNKPVGFDMNLKAEPIMRITGYPVNKNSKFQKIGQGTFTEDTTIFVPPHSRKDDTGTHTYWQQFVLFSTDYYVKQTLAGDRALMTYYDYSDSVIQQSPLSNITVIDAYEARSVFKIGTNYVSYVNAKQGRNYTSVVGFRNDGVEFGIENPSSNKPYTRIRNVGNGFWKNTIACNGKFSAFSTAVSTGDTLYSESLLIGSEKKLTRVEMQNYRSPLFLQALGDRIIGCRSYNYNELVIYFIGESGLESQQTTTGGNVVQSFAESETEYFLITSSSSASALGSAYLRKISKSSFAIEDVGNMEIRYLNK